MALARILRPADSLTGDIGRFTALLVQRADTVKGYEFAQDQYVTFTPDELKEMEEKGTNIVEIDAFRKYERHVMTEDGNLTDPIRHHV